MRRLAVALTTIALLATASAAQAARTKTVRIKDIDFSPALVKIERGDSVTWRFADGDTPHNVASRGKLRFRSSQTKQRGSYTVRFATAGTYSYVCTLHLNMKAKVVVG